MCKRLIPIFLLFPLFCYSQIQTSHTTNEDIRFLLHFPKEYSKSNSSSPLLIFLHGMGERGENIHEVKKYGPPHLIESKNWPENLPFVVISPQLSENYGYWPDFLITHIINYAIENYNIDEQRIYLTGLSLGGMGVWNYAIHHPEKLAAIIPVCGKADPTIACEMDKLPVWAFHGEQDNIVAPSGSVKMIEALRRCKDRSASLTKFTLYPNVKHDSWTITYNNPEIYQWLLQFENRNFNKAGRTEKPKVKQKIQDPPNEEQQSFMREIAPLPVSLTEASGLVYYGNNSLWTHNDGGDLPYIYNIDTAGNIIQTKRITNATNYDWEDLAKDKEGNLYIGDFGNNKNNRQTLQIYKIPSPEKSSSDRINAELISFNYSDSIPYPLREHQMNFDMEAMVVFGQHIYLFSKNRTTPFSGFTKLYRLPLTPGTHTAQLIDSVMLDNNNMLTDWVTGADISPDNKTLALLTSTKVWLFTDFEGDNFFGGSVLQVKLPALSQKEGISFQNDTEIFICDERFQNIIGGKLYKLDISEFIQK